MKDSDTKRSLALTEDERVGPYEWEHDNHRRRLWPRDTPSLGYHWCLQWEYSDGWGGNDLVDDTQAQNHLSEHFRSWLAQRGRWLALWKSPDEWVLHSENTIYHLARGEWFEALLSGMELCLKENDKA